MAVIDGCDRCDRWEYRQTSILGNISDFLTRNRVTATIFATNPKQGFSFLLNHKPAGFNSKKPPLKSGVKGDLGVGAIAP